MASDEENEESFVGKFGLMFGSLRSFFVFSFFVYDFDFIKFLFANFSSLGHFPESFILFQYLNWIYCYIYIFLRFKAIVIKIETPAKPQFFRTFDFFLNVTKLIKMDASAANTFCEGIPTLVRRH